MQRQKCQCSLRLVTISAKLLRKLPYGADKSASRISGMILQLLLVSLNLLEFCDYFTIVLIKHFFMNNTIYRYFVQLLTIFSIVNIVQMFSINMPVILQWNQCKKIGYNINITLLKQIVLPRCTQSALMSRSPRLGKMVARQN